MPRRETDQLNIRSTFARARVQAIARQTGMTAAAIVEDALRGYSPPAATVPPPGLVRRGPLLVRPAAGRRRVSLAEAEAALAASRDREP